MVLVTFKTLKGDAFKIELESTNTVNHLKLIIFSSF
jgi:hypothetical protein